MTTEIQKKEEPGNLRTLILQMKSQFALALPKHITPDRFMRVALTAINKTPKLMACTKESVLACLMDCSALGIEPDGRNAHLIPYGLACTLIIDYKGLVALARRSGEIAYIHADVVCENDKFEYAFGSGAFLKHSPALRDRGAVIQAYSFVKLKDGSEDFHVMNTQEIEATRERSKAGKSGPWVTDFPEMAKKTVFRRHSKWLPLSSEFQEAVEKDFDVPADILQLPEKSVIEMPRPKIEQAKEQMPVDDTVAMATPAQNETLNKLAAQAGLQNEGFFEFLAVRCKNVDALTMSELQICMKDIAAMIDKKAKK